MTSAVSSFSSFCSSCKTCEWTSRLNGDQTYHAHYGVRKLRWMKWSSLESWRLLFTILSRDVSQLTALIGGYTKRDTVRVAPRNHTHTRPVTLTLSWPHTTLRASPTVTFSLLLLLSIHTQSTDSGSIKPGNLNNITIDFNLNYGKFSRLSATLQ